MTAVFAQEKLSEIREEAFPLLLRHWGEIALNKDGTPLDPDWRKYKLLEDAGMFHVTTMRIGGELVGYVAFVVTPNLHYRTMIVAQDDIFYLAPEHRKGRLGLDLLAAAHGAVIAAGANKIVHHHKHHMDLGPVFRRLGFDFIEHTYAKTV